MLLQHCGADEVLMAALLDANDIGTVAYRNYSQPSESGLPSTAVLESDSVRLEASPEVASDDAMLADFDDLMMHVGDNSTEPAPAPAPITEPPITKSPPNPNGQI